MNDQYYSNLAQLTKEYAEGIREFLTALQNDLGTETRQICQSFINMSLVIIEQQQGIIDNEENWNGK